MEKLIGRLNFILLLLISIVFISCNNSEASKYRVENEVEFDTISIVKRHHIEGDANNPYCDIKIEFVYPKSSQEGEIKTIQQFFEKIISEFRLKKLNLNKEFMHTLINTLIINLKNATTSKKML